MKRLNLLVSIVMLISMLLAACGDSEPQVVEKEVTRVVQETIIETVLETVVVAGTPQTVEQEVTRVVEKIVTPTPEPQQAPAVGGNLVQAVGFEVDTLDVHKSGRLWGICQYFGASLIAKDPQTGDYRPYLAESWEVAEDGMRYEFKLRQDVTFHNGAPLTAQDYAWSLNRAKDPKTQSPTAGPALNGVAIAEAADDYTLVLKMAWPNSVLMDTLSDPCYQQPLPQAYVEEMGDEFGRNPVGVGPFKFKEWVTGEKIVLERNPDYTWGPEWTHGGPPYIETLEFRTIPEYATQLAGLEAGEVDWITPEIKDLERLQSAGQYQIFELMQRGGGTHIAMNSTRPPFDDVRVRQAFNHAINKAPFVQVVELGHAEPLYGPLTPATAGYWPGAEYIGYEYNLDKALALMTEAGWTDSDGDGVLDKDGQALTVDLKVTPYVAKHAEILQEQLKAFGAKVEIQQLEPGVHYETVGSGDFDMTIDTLGWPNFGILFAMLHSSMIGAWNRPRVTDLDGMIGAMTAAPNWEQAVEAATELQKEVIAQAYYVPLYAGKSYIVLSDRVKGALYSSVTQLLYLQDAYIETTTE